MVRVLRLVFVAMLLLRRRDAARVREIRSRDLLHRRASFHCCGAPPLLLGNGVRIPLAVLDRLALDADGRSNLLLARRRLGQRHHERAFLAHDLRLTPVVAPIIVSIIAPIIAPIIVSVVTAVWVVFDGSVSHLGLRGRATRYGSAASRLHLLDTS